MYSNSGEQRSQFHIVVSGNIQNANVTVGDRLQSPVTQNSRLDVVAYEA